MFGIGGGELVFILFIVLMLFGSDKVPEMARTMGKAMAQLKNATNDIKSEIQKGAEANGFDQKTLNELTGGINSEINKAKSSILGDTSNTFTGITDTFTSEVNKTNESLASGSTNPDGSSILEDITGPVKRQM
ncbi:sec-independent protein translocase protein TatA [Flavobacterium sp. 1]|uniref:Sec-independent protein translocase subunit TatA/TatB n=1 Tax=Flavobacterium sp. 1 TaxID=2035200 RepID=UPI000C233120|nr:twin-arginine translocase TatA/TatE family subunit [Flavobacterium sp. 1]PJJ09435.1 sec-independent protein translocase protein TatA [Flavobacterium sp. 1]